MPQRAMSRQATQPHESYALCCMKQRPCRIAEAVLDILAGVAQFAALRCRRSKAIVAQSNATANAGGRVCILVTGMHRSGTSALTRVLGFIGAGLPRNPLKANAHNETGFWEPEPIVLLHEELLREIGRKWNDLGRFNLSALGAERLRHYQAAIIRILDEEYGSSRIFAVKDPRLCVLAPLWITALATAGIGVRFVLPIRDAAEVAHSLAKRDLSSIRQGYMLWLRHVLDAEHASRCHQRIFVRYSDLLRDPPAVAASLAVRLPDELSMSAEAGRLAASFIDGKLRHHVAAAADPPQADGLEDWLAATHDSYARLVSNPDDGMAQRQLDRLRAEFDAACNAFVPLLRSTEHLLDASAQEAAMLKQGIADRDSTMAQQAEKLTEFRSTLDSVYRSTSWRVTAPLRAALSLVKRQPTS